MTLRSLLLAAAIALSAPSWAQAQHHARPAAAGIVTGQRVYELTQQLLAAAPKRYINSSGHAAAENFIKSHFAPEIAKGQFQTDAFSANTPLGQLAMRNYIVRYPSRNTTGKQDGAIVLVSHYETNYPLKDTGFVGANDGACTTAMLIALGEHLRTHPPDGYAVWLVFDDGEEAIRQWSATDSLYGTRHLAAKWSGDGTLRKIKGLIVVDMVGDKDLNIDRVDNSTPWMLDVLQTAARNTHHTANIFKLSHGEDDDHIPFIMRGVPALDMLDAEYGPSTDASPDGYHHTAQDTIDKISARSLQISADLILEMIKLIDQH